MQPIPFGFRQIDYLIAVAETGSTAAAARLLNVSQPSVSVAVAQMEAHLGAAMFLRLPGQGMQPTRFGRETIARLRALRQDAAVLFDAQGPRPFALRLGVYSTLGPRYAPMLMRAFSERHAGARITLVEDNLAALMRQVESGRLDLALIYDVGVPAGLHLTPLADIAPRAVLWPDHPLAAAPAVDLRALAADPLILIDLPQSRGYFLSLFQLVGAHPRIAAETGSIEMLRAMVANGLGVGLLATDLPYDTTYDGRRVQSRPLAGDLPPSRIVLVRNPGERPGAAIEAFEGLARALIGGQGVAGPVQ
ncbi:MAG: LysR family transcriptional regulator [Pararhodobacter sp.]